MTAPSLFRLPLLAILTSVAVGSFSCSSSAEGVSPPVSTATNRLSCKFTDQPIPRACTERSGTITVRGTRVFKADAVTFPPELQVYEINLQGLGGPPGFQIARRGAYIGSTMSRFELFQADTRFHPARWPAAGFSRAITLNSDKTSAALPAEDFAKFSGERDLWLGAYWTTDWAFETAPVKALSPETNTLVFSSLKSPHPIRQTFPFYIFNALAALSSPGTYVLDEKTQTVYAASKDGSDTFEIGTEQTLLELSGARNLRLTGLKLQKTLGTALVIKDSENITIDGCEIRHVGQSAIRIVGGKNVVVTNCRIEDTAETAIEVSGGDRKTLTPAGHVVRGSTIAGFGLDGRSSRAGIQLRGVGIRVQDNTIEHGPHSAIILTGNDHVISGNEIRNVVEEADDAGALYTGRDWTERGNIIRNNWFHDIGMPDAPGADLALGRKLVAGVYLDDQESGYLIEGNVFDRVSMPVFIHGGRDNHIKKNAFLRCGESAIYLARRGEGMTGGTLETRLKAVPYRKEPWVSKYPALAKLTADQPAEPLHNRETRNIAIGCPLFGRAKNTDAHLWPDIGKTSRVIADRPGLARRAAEILKELSLGCKAFPVLCTARAP